MKPERLSQYRTHSVLAARRWLVGPFANASQRGRCGYGVGVLAMLLVFTLFLGCISSQGGIERPQTLWTIGQTTRKDVVAAWGGPDAVFGDVWVWRNRTTAGGQLKASFMMIGATVRNLVFSAYEFRLTFGPDGRLVDEQVVDFTPGQDEWSINPWD